jgi:hypothetical protein
LSPQSFDGCTYGSGIRGQITPFLPKIACRTQRLNPWQRELDACRQQNGVPKEHGLARIQKRKTIEDTRKRIGHQAPYNVLVLVVGETKNEKVVTLAQYGPAYIRWTLADNQQRDTVLPALLRDPLETIESLSLDDIGIILDGQVQMGLVAYKHERRSFLCLHPELNVIEESREDTRHNR